MNNAVFGKTMENVRKHKDIKSITTDKRRNQLASEPKYHTTKAKCFSEKLLAIEMKKAKVKMNKLVYLGMSILGLQKMYCRTIFFLVNDTTLPSENPLRFRKNIFEINI